MLVSAVQAMMPVPFALLVRFTASYFYIDSLPASVIFQSSFLFLVNVLVFYFE